MKITSKVNQKHLNDMQVVFQRAQIKTVDALKSDLQKSQTLPHGDTGELKKNIETDKDYVKNGIVRIAHEGLAYPRRLYFHPEYNYRKDKNANAGGLWFEPYLTGNKKEMPQKLFEKFVKKEKNNVIKD